MGRVAALTLLAIALPPLYATPPHSRSTTKKTSSEATRHTAVARTSTHNSVAAAHYVRGKAGRKGHMVRAAASPAYQLHPDPDRYQAIQKALADRGYFKGEPNGQWGGDSTDAMRRFQTDQKIDNDGKIDSLSLIGLGLGPKHNAIATSPETAASNPSPLQPLTPNSSGTQ